MLKRLFALAITLFAGTGVAAAASGAQCPPVTIAFPAAVHYEVQTCMPSAQLPPLTAQCLNCPGEQAHIVNRSNASCVLERREYTAHVVFREMVNGRCVPVAKQPPARSFNEPPVASIERSFPIAAPPVQRPVERPPVEAPAPVRGAPHVSPPSNGAPQRPAPPAPSRPIHR